MICQCDTSRDTNTIDTLVEYRAHSTARAYATIQLQPQDSRKLLMNE